MLHTLFTVNIIYRTVNLFTVNIDLICLLIESLESRRAVSNQLELQHHYAQHYLLHLQVPLKSTSS